MKYEAGYKYSKDDLPRDLSSYSVEQQASIIEDYFSLKNSGCKTLEDFQSIKDQRENTTYDEFSDMVEIFFGDKSNGEEAWNKFQEDTCSDDPQKEYDYIQKIIINPWLGMKKP